MSWAQYTLSRARQRTLMTQKSWKNYLLLKAIKRLARPRHAPPSPENLLVVATTALGDTLWATPALAALKSQFPSARIAVLTGPIGKELLRHNPAIDELILLEEPVLPRFFPLLFRLKKRQFDAALIFHASQRLVLPLCALSSIPRIIGTLGINKGLDELLTDAVPSRYEHEIERRFGLIEQLGAKRGDPELAFHLQPDERLNLPKEKPLVAFHPGSKEAFRRWPPSHFAAVGKALEERFGCKIHLTGSPSERPLLEKIQRLLPSASIEDSFSSVRKLAAFFNEMDLILSNDTGPFHLACALKRPVIGIYVSTDPNLCGPHQAKSASIVSRPPTCTPCLKRRCHDPFCFLQIGPKEVIELCAQKLLLKGSALKNPAKGRSPLES